MKTLFLIAASIITISSVLPYARDILKGSTKPNIVSWITWTLLTGVATVAEFAAHEYTTALFTLSAVIETGLIVVLGWKYGYAKYSRFDIVCQIGALSGFLLWWLFNNPVLAIVAAVSIDLLGTLPTVRHSWMKPNEETWPTYAIAGLGGVIALFALTTYNWASLSYPIYIVLINTLLSLILIVRRSRSSVPTMTTLQVGVKVLLKNEEGKYLFMRRSPLKYPETQKWDIPGGRINPGTTLAENLEREVMEETGLTMSGTPRLIVAQDILKTQGLHAVRLTYIGEAHGDVRLSEEHVEYIWLTADQFDTLEPLDRYVKILLAEAEFQIKSQLL